MVKGKARAAGSFLGGLANNPAIVIIALVLGGLFIFRDKISEGISGLGESLAGGLGNIDIKLPEFNLPSFDFDFPSFDFEFPDISQSFTDAFSGAGDFFSGLQTQFDNFLTGAQDQISSIAGQTVEGQGEEQVIVIPPDTMIDPDTGIVTSETPPISTGAGATQEELTFAQVRAQAFDTLFDLGVSGSQAQAEISALPFGDISALNDLVARFEQFFGQPEPEPLVQPVEQPVTPVQPVEVGLPSGFEFFQTEGSSGFVGGSINQTPIANLSLSQIIDMFNVTASQAANILAIAQDNFGDFDFGTNTGTGIGSVFQDLGLSSILPSGNVSQSEFEGLSATEIANLLTGGNIQNF